MKKATEQQFNELHGLVTADFLKRIKSGEATTQDLKAACDWLKTNDITINRRKDGSPIQNRSESRRRSIVPKLSVITVSY